MRKHRLYRSLKVRKAEWEKAEQAFGYGGCAILAYALWKKLPNWYLCRLANMGEHALVVHPSADMAIDIYGIQSLWDKAERHYLPEVPDYEEYITFFKPDEKEDMDAYIKGTASYTVPARSIENLENKVEKNWKEIQFWVDVLINQAKAKRPDLFVEIAIAA